VIFLLLRFSLPAWADLTPAHPSPQLRSLGCGVFAPAMAAQAPPAAVPQAPPPPSPPSAPVPPALHEEKGWRFEAVAEPLWPSDRIDELGKDEDLCKVPDMFCGNASLRISHEASGFQLELGAMEALRCCRWRPPPAAHHQPLAEAVVADGGKELDGPFLGAIKCQFAERWKPKSENPDVKELQVTSDWTCSTAYWGSAAFHGGAAASAEVTEECLPMDLLRRRDEIHWYNEILFWEDELDDNGVCRVSIRVRVMPTFWFALLLCELRVDNVLIREVATRFVCSFDSDHVLREWTWKEASYEALRSHGVRIADNPSISQMSVGTNLLEQVDVRRQLRHKLQLSAKA